MDKEKDDERRVVYVIGAGGIGFWLAVSLAKADLRVVIYDDDNLEGGHGHERLPIALPSTLKVDLLTGFLRVNFGSAPEVVRGRFTGKEAGPGDIVADCSDMDGKTRRTIWTLVRKAGARPVRVSYDGAQSTVVVAEGLPLTGNESAAGYANIPSLPLSLLAGGLGGEVIRLLAQALDAGSEVGHIEFQISLADFVAVREVQAA